MGREECLERIRAGQEEYLRHHLGEMLYEWLDANVLPYLLWKNVFKLGQ